MLFREELKDGVKVGTFLCEYLCCDVHDVMFVAGSYHFFTKILFVFYFQIMSPKTSDDASGINYFYSKSRHYRTF